MGTHLDLFQRIVVSPCSVSAILYSVDGPVVLAVNSTGDLASLVPVMSSFDLPAPDVFTAGTVGRPGAARVLPAGCGTASSSSPCAARSSRSPRWPTTSPGCSTTSSRRPTAMAAGDLDLREPFEEIWTVGPSASPTTSPSDRIVVVLEELVDEDAEEGESVKVRLNRAQVSAFVQPRARAGVSRPAAVPLLRTAARPRRPRLPPDELVPADAAAANALQHGEVEVLGRMPWSSNATYLCEVTCGDDVVRAIYKPRRGERPLWDFPSGLDHREVAAYELSEALGWDLVPLTILPRRTARRRLAAAVRRRRLRAALLHPLRGRGQPRPAPRDVRLRPRRQQHRSQERPLPARPRRTDPRHRPRPDVPPRVQAADRDLGVRRRGRSRTICSRTSTRWPTPSCPTRSRRCSTRSSVTPCGHAPGPSCEPGASRSTRPAGATPGRSSDVEAGSARVDVADRTALLAVERHDLVAQRAAAHGLAGEPRRGTARPGSAG